MDLLAAFCRQRKGWIMPKTHENTQTHSINDALRDHATAARNPTCPYQKLRPCCKH